jgi:hypothetical protein
MGREGSSNPHIFSPLGLKIEFSCRVICLDHPPHFTLEYLDETQILVAILLTVLYIDGESLVPGWDVLVFRVYGAHISKRSDSELAPTFTL